MAPPPPVQWSPCGALQCGTVSVPLSYADPGGAAISLALVRHPAQDPDQRLGSLVIDPGGPGVSGVDDMDNELSSLTPELLEDFDIVMFDPRGVQRSDPVTCGEAPGGAPATGPSTPAPDPVPQTPAAITSLIDALRSYADACDKASADLLPYVGTVDAARDLDRIRAALGDQALTYMGQSYGTLLGATYAEMFPTHVRAMFLDSAVDPALSSQQMIEAQAVGFENSLNDFFGWCAVTVSCPWRPSGDPTAAVLDLINEARHHPIPAGGGSTIGPGEIYDALLSGLYSQSDWPTLADALSQAASGNGALVLHRSNTYGQNGASNGGDAASAISCLDHTVPRQLSAYPALAAQAATTAPVFGPLLAWGQAGCAVWPVPPTRTPGPIHADGSPPIVVVGTTGDPATPYAWAVALASQLQHGVLVTRDGVDHVAYFYSSCVRALAQSYLVDLTVPPNGTTCSS
jgi:pimeloyl-ACP methyl ester carboxylesterase